MERNQTMRKVLAVVAAAVVAVGVVYVGLAGSRTDSSRAGKEGVVSFRLASTSPVRGFEAMTFGDDRTVYVAPQAALSAGAVVSAEAIATRNGSDISLSLTDESAGRLGAMLDKGAADQLAIFVGDQLVSSGAFSFDAGSGRATISGLSSANARRVTRVINRRRTAPVGTAITVVPSQTTIEPGEVVTVDIFVTGGLSDLRAYQLELEISEGASGVLTISEMWMDTQRLDYVFRGLDKLDAVDRIGKRVGAVLLSGGSQPMDRGYLASAALIASEDASGTFSVTIRTKDTSMVESRSNQMIRFSEGPPAEITIGAQQLRRLPAEQR